MPASKQEAEQDATNQFEWIQVRESINQFSGETAKEKFLRKIGDNPLGPLVPVGCLLTASALSYGLWSFKKGNRKMSQRMMRVRVLAQGFTVAALIIGIGISATRTGSK